MENSDQPSPRRWFTLAACVLIGLLNEVSGGVLGLSLGPAARDLQAPPSVMQVAMTISKLFFGALMLAGGAMGDAYGRRKVIVWGALVISGASLLAAAAQSGGALVLARALDGLGNALVGPLALALVAATFSSSREAQSKAIAVFMGASGLGVAVGPLVAGAIVQYFGWRSGFLAPLALAILGALGVLSFARENRVETTRPGIDFPGAVACTLGLLGLILGISQAREAGWDSPRTWGPLLLGVVALGLFVRRERMAARPLFDLALLRDRRNVAALIAVFVSSMAVSGGFIPLLYFLQLIQGMSAFESILALTPMVVAAALLAPAASALSARLGRRPIITGGLLLVATGCLLIGLVRPETPYWRLLFACLLIGAGYIFITATAADLILGSASEESSGGAAALSGASVQVGGAFGAAILVAVFLSSASANYYARLAHTGLSEAEIKQTTQTLRDEIRTSIAAEQRSAPIWLQQEMRQAFRSAFALGMRRAFALCALLCLLAAPVAWVRMREG